MLSVLLRAFNRQTFKCIQNPNSVKRFYHDFNGSDSEDNNQSIGGQHRSPYFHDFNDEFNKLYNEYYKRYYDRYYEIFANINNKFDSNFSANNGRQSDDSSGSQSDGKGSKGGSDSNTFSFKSDCKYHLLTVRLLEKISVIGAAIVVGLHFEPPLDRRYSLVLHGRHRFNRRCNRLDTTANKDEKSWKSKFCGNCRYCTVFLSKLFVSSAPIGENYIFYKITNGAIDYPKIVISVAEEAKCLSDPIPQSIAVEDKKLEAKPKLDPIDAICRDLEKASIQYVDHLYNIVGLSLIDSDPGEAMKCWSSTHSSSKALFNMGVAFESGRHSSTGTPDLKKAYLFYKASAELGHKRALYNEALFHLQGKGGIAKNLNEAEVRLRSAAKSGVKPAVEYIQLLDVKRAQTKPTNFMRYSASAPDLYRMNTENIQTRAVANRVQ